MVKIMGISDIAATIEQFRLGMMKEYNIHLQIKECNRCAICGDPDVEDKDFEYPYGGKQRGCCSTCYERDFLNYREPTVEDVMNGYE